MTEDSRVAENQAKLDLAGPVPGPSRLRRRRLGHRTPHWSKGGERAKTATTISPRSTRRASDLADLRPVESEDLRKRMGGGDDRAPGALVERAGAAARRAASRGPPAERKPENSAVWPPPTTQPPPFAARCRAAALYVDTSFSFVNMHHMVRIED